jgi:hypothetical protein
MTKLILAPFDPAAPGSHSERMRMLDLASAYEDAQGSGNGASMARVAKRINDIVLKRMRTDDGTPVEAAMEQLSANDYDLLVQGMWNVADADTVPLAST